MVSALSISCKSTRFEAGCLFVDANMNSYDPDFEEWQLGKLSALREIALAFEGQYKWYYMGQHHISFLVASLLLTSSRILHTLLYQDEIQRRIPTVVHPWYAHQLSKPPAVLTQKQIQRASNGVVLMTNTERSSIAILTSLCPEKKG